MPEFAESTNGSPPSNVLESTELISIRSKKGFPCAPESEASNGIGPKP